MQPLIESLTCDDCPMGGSEVELRVEHQRYPHAKGVAKAGRTNLLQPEADGGDAGVGQLGTVQAQPTQVDRQGVGQCRLQQPKLVGLDAVEACRRTSTVQVELRFLDPVLGLAASAVHALVPSRPCKSGFSSPIRQHAATACLPKPSNCAAPTPPSRLV